MNGMQSPQKENNEYSHEQNQRNPNRQFFQKQQNQQGSNQSNQNSLKTPPLPFNQYNSNSNNHNINNKNNNGRRVEQSTQINDQAIGSVTNSQLQVKSSSNTNRRKIFSSDDDASSIVSQQTNKQNNHQKSSLQIFAPLGIQKQGINQQNVQQQNQQQSNDQHTGFIKQQNFSGNNQQVSYNNNNNNNNVGQNKNLQEMYSELLQQYNQLKELKFASEETHNLEIEDTKKHYEYKLQESLKKQQEVVMKMQNQQQNISQVQLEVKTLQEEIRNKDEQLRNKDQQILISKQQISQSDSSKQDQIKLKEKKEELETIIRDGKLYIQQIQNQSEDKSREILNLQEEIQGYQIQLNKQIENFEINKNNCLTMRQEIQQLIASNLDLQKMVENERKEKDEKVSEYQRILSRVGQSYTIKSQEEDKQKKMQDLEVSLKNMIDRNSEQNTELKVKLSYIDSLHSLLKQKGVSVQQISQLQNQQQGIQNKFTNAQGLSQITEEQEEDSYIEIPKRMMDINSQNIEQLRTYVKQQFEDTEQLKNQAITYKNKYNLVCKENDILRANSQLAISNPNYLNGSSQTYLDRIKELNSQISQLQKDKETLIYENTVIVNQMKKERINREQEVGLLSNQIKNYQKLSSLTSATTPSIANSSQIITTAQQQDLAFNNPQLSSIQSQQQSQSNISIPPTYQQQLSNVHLPPTHKVITSKNQIPPKNPTTLPQQQQQQQQQLSSQPFNSSLIGHTNTSNDKILNSSQLQSYRLGSNNQQVNQIQSTSLKRTASYDGNLSQAQNIYHPLGMISQLPQQNNPQLQSAQKEEYDMNQSNLINQNINMEGANYFAQQQINQKPLLRNQSDLNTKLNQFSQFNLPQTVSYVIARPGENNQAISSLTTNQVQQNQTNIKIMQQQPYHYPTQVSFGEFGDILQQVHNGNNQDVVQQPHEQHLGQISSQQRISISPIVNGQTTYQQASLEQLHTNAYNESNRY